MTKRPHPSMPVLVKLDVVIRQEGKCACGCNQKLGSLKEIEFDHVPALIFREYDPETKLYTPDANDPTRIFAKRIECHLKKTVKDIKANAKVKRLQNPKQPRGTIKSRGFDKSLSRRFSGAVVPRER